MSKYSSYFKRIPSAFRDFSRRYDVGMLGEIGRGAGKGGGAGGPIREAGGPFGKLGAAREEEYFHKLQRRLLLALKGKLNEENVLRQQEIKKHQIFIEKNIQLTKEIDEKLGECGKRK